MEIKMFLFSICLLNCFVFTILWLWRLWISGLEKLLLDHSLRKIFSRLSNIRLHATKHKRETHGNHIKKARRPGMGQQEKQIVADLRLSSTLRKETYEKWNACQGCRRYIRVNRKIDAVGHFIVKQCCVHTRAYSRTHTYKHNDAINVSRQS